MIIVRYRGGLGNQMFQYAFSYALGKRFSDEKIYADISHYEIQKEHNGFELNKCFGIQINELKKDILRKYSPFLVVPNIFNKAPRFIKDYVESSIQFKYHKKRINGINSNGVFYYCQKTHNDYDNRLFEVIEEELNRASVECIYLDGLWQDIRYFDEYRNELVQIFKLPNLDKAKINADSIGIHVRCGDFLKSKFDICSSEYYKKAIDIVSNHNSDKENNSDNANSTDNVDGTSNELTKFYVFTDDIVHAMQIMGNDVEMQYINNGINGSLKDMAMMGKCKNLIISNSTFSFWAAYLNSVDMVVAPKYSIINNENQKYELNTPNNWIRIDNSND